MSRFVILNQMAGPLFIDLTTELSSYFSNGCLLYTSHPDAVSKFSFHNPNIKLVKSPNYNRESPIKRLTSWLKYLVGCSYLILFSVKNDVFLLSTNPPLLPIWFWILSRVKKTSYCIVIYDIYPEVLVSSGMLNNDNFIVKAWNYLNGKAYKNSSLIITISNGLANKLCEVHPQIHPKIKVVYPWADTVFIKPINPKFNRLYQKLNPNGKKVVLYAGNMGISHDIDSILKVADLIRQREDILFLFVGGGDAHQQVVNFKNDNKLMNISIHTYQPLHVLPDLLSLATVSLVALEDDKQDLMVPSKLFSYFAAGSPVIGISSVGKEVHSIIEKNKCGACVPPGNPQALAEILVNILDDDLKMLEFSTNARSTALKKFSKELGVSKFVEYFHRHRLIS